MWNLIFCASPALKLCDCILWLNSVCSKHLVTFQLPFYKHSDEEQDTRGSPALHLHEEMTLLSDKSNDWHAEGNMCFCCSERLKIRKGEVEAIAKLLLPQPNEGKDSFKPVKIKTKDHSRLNHLWTLQHLFWIKHSHVMKIRNPLNFHVSPIHIIVTSA